MKGHRLPVGIPDVCRRAQHHYYSLHVASRVVRWTLLIVAMLAVKDLVELRAFSTGANRLGSGTCIGTGRCSRARDVRLRLLLQRRAGNSAASWVKDWIEAEIRKRPVVLFTDSNTESRAAKSSLESARIHFDTVEVGRLDFGPPLNDGDEPWSVLVRKHLASNVGCTEMPVLFVNGQAMTHEQDIQKLDPTKLRSLCLEAGAVDTNPVEPPPNMTWTVRKDGRWLPAKNLNGRRWYRDDPNMELSPDEHKDPARIEYVIDGIVPGAGSSQYGRFKSSMLSLLRQDTNLDKPDKNGVVKMYPPFTTVDLLLTKREDWRGDFLRSRDVEKSKAVGPEDAIQMGLPEDQLIWVYKLGKLKLRDELKRRQCSHKFYSTMDVQGMRELLFDELRKEHAFSPTYQGVLPGIVPELSDDEFRRERQADTDVPLLLVAVDSRSPTFYRFRQSLKVAAGRLLRTIRIVQVDCAQFPSIAREHKVVRFPTLVWLQSRTGEQLTRDTGVMSTTAIIERTRALVEGRELPAPRKNAALTEGGHWDWHNAGTAERAHQRWDRGAKAVAGSAAGSRAAR